MKAKKKYKKNWIFRLDFERKAKTGGKTEWQKKATDIRSGRKHFLTVSLGFPVYNKIR